MTCTVVNFLILRKPHGGLVAEYNVIFSGAKNSYQFKGLLKNTGQAKAWTKGQWLRQKRDVETTYKSNFTMVN